MGKNNFLKQSAVGVTLTSMGVSLLSGQEQHIVSAAWYTAILNFLWDWTVGWFVKRENKENNVEESITGKNLRSLLNGVKNGSGQKDYMESEDLNKVKEEQENLENKGKSNIEELGDDAHKEEKFEPENINNPIKDKRQLISDNFFSEKNEVKVGKIDTNKENNNSQKISGNLKGEDSKIKKGNIKIEENKKKQEIKVKQEILDKYKVQLDEKNKSLRELERDYENKIANFREGNKLIEVLKYEKIPKGKCRVLVVARVELDFRCKFLSKREEFFKDSKKVEDLRKKDGGKYVKHIEKFKTFDIDNVNCHADDDFLEFLKKNSPNCYSYAIAFRGALAAGEVYKYDSEEEIREEFKEESEKIVNEINYLENLIKEAEAGKEDEINFSNSNKILENIQ